MLARLVLPCTTTKINQEGNQLRKLLLSLNPSPNLRNKKKKRNTSHNQMNMMMRLSDAVIF
jgi:hypothetical protein